MIWRRLHLDQRGTAMTEFVITLPAFIVIFGGIVGLHKLQDSATRAHPMAYRAMWEQAYAVANTEADDPEWADPGAFEYDRQIFRETEDRPLFGYDQAKGMRLHDYGTLGEALNGEDFEQASQWRFQLEGARDDTCTHCAYDAVHKQDGAEYNQAGFAYFATWDAGAFPMPIPTDVAPEIAGMKAVVGAGPMNSVLAYGAGTRYGIVVASATTVSEWRGIVKVTSPQYQVTAPSRTMEDDAEGRHTVATVRVMLEKEKAAMSDIPGFEVERGFTYRHTDL